VYVDSDDRVSQGYVGSKAVVPLPPEIINSYIDKFPAIVVVKLKEKFDGLADRESRELSLAGFLQLYSRTGVAAVRVG
jgi:hypothetical protein